MVKLIALLVVSVAVNIFFVVRLWGATVDSNPHEQSKCNIALVPASKLFQIALTDALCAASLQNKDIVLWWVAYEAPSQISLADCEVEKASRNIFESCNRAL
eukprot:280047-Amphidinium_carterae.1